MNNDVADFVTEVFAATSSDAIWEATAGFCENLGFGNVVYGVRHPKSGSTPLDLRMTPPLLPWREVYLAHGDDRRDPLFSYAAKMPPSFYTGPEFLPDHTYLQPEDKAVIERGAAFGFISGLAFVMPSQDENVVAGWNILTGLKRDDAIVQFSQFGGVLQMATTLAYREMVHREDIQRKQSTRLSPRQKECLQWLASGLRNEQIAEKMSIRPVTVDLHLREARTQLGAQTREQALAIAISEGLIAL